MIYGSVICTKPGNARRFHGPWSRAIGILRLPCGARLIYCAEDAAIASQARACGKLEYNAGRDIDRYCLYAACKEGDLDSCPAYQKIRELVERLALDGRRFDRNAVTVDVEPNAVNGEMVVTRVCEGDGRCGPIAFECTDHFAAWWHDLKTISLACEFCRQPGEVCADGGNGERRNGDAAVRVPGDGVVDGADDGSENVHGGIIAFFKRLLGRRAE